MVYIINCVVWFVFNGRVLIEHTVMHQFESQMDKARNALHVLWEDLSEAQTGDKEILLPLTNLMQENIIHYNEKIESLKKISSAQDDDFVSYVETVQISIDILNMLIDYLNQNQGYVCFVL